MVLLAMTVVSLALLVGFSPPGAGRKQLAVKGLVGLVAAAAIALTPSLPQVAAILVLVACAQAGLPGPRPFPLRLRALAMAAVLMLFGSIVLETTTAEPLARLAVLALLLAMVAALGLVPYLQGSAPEEPVAASALVWLGFLGPVLAMTLASRIMPMVPPAAASTFGAILIGLGLVNLTWGLLGAWESGDDRRAWHRSFLADWGLALVGLGMVVPTGRAGAFLIMAAVLLGKLPLSIWALHSNSEATPTQTRLSILLAALLAGLAPFAGFPARLLILRSAVTLYWPLAACLGLAMLLWLVPAMRLARTVRPAPGRVRAGIAVVVAVSIAAGLYPAPLLALARLVI